MKYLLRFVVNIFPLQKNAFYIKPKVADGRFGIRHYAGEVFYETKGFLDKNRDTFRDDILEVLKESRYY